MKNKFKLFTIIITVGILFSCFQSNAQVRLGNAFRWWNNTAEFSNANKASSVFLNDGNLTNLVGLASGDGQFNANASAVNLWEAAGLIFANPVTVNKFTFINGVYTGTSDDGAWSSDVRMQGTIDGTTWFILGSWIISPAYLYNSATVNGATFTATFTGAAPSLLGIRVLGQVRSRPSPSSWEAELKEISAEFLSTLPITLKSFEITGSNCTVSANWSTLTEVNVKTIELQKSIDGLNFETVAMQLPNNKSSTYQKQVYLTPAVVNYFRLKTTDNDGTFTFSELRTKKCGFDVKSEIKVYPNPATSNFMINELSDNAHIKIQNAAGVQVYSAKADGTSHVVQVNNWAKGMYIISITNAKEVISKKIIVE